MDPKDISKKAEQERKRKKEEENSPKKEPFNPFDWMDFKNTRKWMGKNLKLSDTFYHYLAFLIMLIVVSGWIWLDDWNENIWKLNVFLGLLTLFIFSCIIGFIYGYVKAHNKKQ